MIASTIRIKSPKIIMIDLLIRIKFSIPRKHLHIKWSRKDNLCHLSKKYFDISISSYLFWSTRLITLYIKEFHLQIVPISIHINNVINLILQLLISTIFGDINNFEFIILKLSFIIISFAPSAAIEYENNYCTIKFHDSYITFNKPHEKIK